MPRLKLKRFKVTPPSPAVFARYALHFDGHTLHHAPHTLPSLAPRTVFGDERPLLLDIGSGRGEFLRELATTHPDHNVLGLEWHRKSVYDTVNKLHAAGLTNARVVLGDVRAALVKMPDGVVAEAFLLFPPPRTDPRQQKADLLSPRQMRTYHRVLRPGAHFHFVTDDDAYFAQKVAQLAASPAFDLLHTTSGFEGGQTAFQQRWEQWGIRSKRAAFRRV